MVVRYKAGDKVRFVKDRYEGLSHGVPVGSVGKVVEVAYYGEGDEGILNDVVRVYNPNWDEKHTETKSTILAYWPDELELISRKNWPKKELL